MRSEAPPDPSANIPNVPMSTKLGTHITQNGTFNAPFCAQHHVRSARLHEPSRLSMVYDQSLPKAANPVALDCTAASPPTARAASRGASTPSAFERKRRFLE